MHLNRKQIADIINFDDKLKNVNEQSVIDRMRTKVLSPGKMVNNLLSTFNYAYIEKDKKGITRSMNKEIVENHIK